MKYNLSNFKVVGMVKGNPTMSITRNGITFSQAAIQKLAKPEFVEFLIDDDNKVLAVVAKQEKTDNSFRFFSPEKEIITARIGNKDFRNQLAELMSWTLDKDEGYRIDGEFDKDSNALFFDLKKAKLLNNK
jgi:hypothetical protein